jgi:RNA polymerase sigma factor (sigma-70 family)
MAVQECTREQHVELTDTMLMEQSLAGNETAFEMLVQRYHTPLLSFIGRHVRDYEQARDVAQHVWLQLYLSMPKLYAYMPLFRTHIKDPLRAWLFKVAWNRCIQEGRKKRTTLFSELESVGELSVLELLQDTQPLPEEIAELNDVRQALRRAIDTLAPKYRSIVLLRYSRELSFLEIGQLLNMPENTAKTYFHRALPKLLTALKAS